MYFRTQEHTVPACHIREYPASTAHSQEEVLHLHVKQYTPLDTTEPPADAVTLVGAHAIGFPKELYEPLWDELYQRSKAQGFSIRGIWIADVANLGLSSVLNEGKLGNDASWMDHSRDLLLVINHFREQMPRPIVGIGHSFGGCQMINLSLMHPRLLSSVILLDPVIQLSPNETVLGTNPPGMLNVVTYRRDLWPSRQTAAANLAKSPMFASWDKRVFERMVRYGLRDLPTPLYPDPPSGHAATDLTVTLTTTKHQEIRTLIRQNYRNRDASGHIRIDRSTHADLDPFAAFIPLYRPEPRATFLRLAAVRPSVLFLVGGASELRVDELREGIKVTGTGVGGSGGLVDGRVKEISFPGRGHLFPLEIVDETAQECAGWLGQEVARWRDEQDKWERERVERSGRDGMVIDEAFKEIVKPPRMVRRPANTQAKL